MRTLAALALLAALLGGQEPPDPFLTERILSPGALLYLSVPQSPAASEDYAKSHLARLFRNEEVASFLEPLEKWWKRRKTEAGADPSWNDAVKEFTGFTIDELWDLLGGPLSAAVYDLPLNEEHALDIVLSLGAADPNRLSKAAATFKETLRKNGANLAEGEFRHQGATVYELGVDEVKFFYTVTQKTLLVATSQDRIRKVLDAAADKTAQGLRADPKFKAARARAAPGDRHLALLYLDLSGALKTFRKEIGDETLRVLETLGVSDITSAAGAVAYDGPYLRERYALLTARQDRGILKFLSGGTPADPAARWVPSGALVYSHFGLNLPELYDVLLAASRISPEFEQQFARGLKEYEERLGLKLRDVLATVGTSWTAFSAFPPAGGVIPDSAYVVSLADPAAFETAVEKMARDAKFPLEEMTFRGQKIRWVTLGFGGPADFFLGTPLAWFIRDKFLFVAGDALSLKRQVVRLSEKGPSIAEDPRFQAIASRIPREEWESWYYMDFGRLFNILYSTLEPLAHPFRDLARDEKGELVVDLARLPLGETLAELLGPTLTNKRTLPDAILVDSYSHTALGSTSGLVVAGAALAIAVPLALAGGEPSGPAANERIAELTLKFILQAEETFKNSDSDRNGAADYWTRDLAGLYALKDRSGQAIFLIERATAQADPDGAARYTLGSAPRNGYWFKMMATDPDGEPYQKDDDKDGKAFTHKSRFAVSAYPAEYGLTGRFTFIISEQGQVFKKDTGGKAVDKWPGKDPSQEGWQPVD